MKENWKVEIKDAGEETKKLTSVTHIIFVSGPKGGNYMFYRNQNKNQTWFGCGNSIHSKAHYRAVELAENAGIANRPNG